MRGFQFIFNEMVKKEDAEKTGGLFEDFHVKLQKIFDWEKYQKHCLERNIYNAIIGRGRGIWERERQRHDGT